MSLRVWLLVLTQHIEGIINFLHQWDFYIIIVISFATFWLLYYTWFVPLMKIHVLEDVGYSHLDKSKQRTSKAKSEWIKESQRRRKMGDMPPVYPNGWFNILESSDLEVGQVKHVQALGENFAIMRDSKGEVHVLDAYCPHLGANMAVGGVVRGDFLECPFHGWQFRGEDGTCTHIPYSDKVPKSARVKRWHSSEVNNLILVWYHAEGEPPSWQVDRNPQIESGELWFAGQSEYIINCHIQDTLENAVDFAHFNILHKPAVLAGEVFWERSRFWSTVMQHLWKAQWNSNITSEEQHCISLTFHHTLQLFGTFQLFSSAIFLKQVGPALFFVENKPVYTMVTVTPLEPDLQRWVHYFYSPPLLVPYAKLVIFIESVMGERDVLMWNHKKYVPKPLLCKEEEAVLKHRRWYKQFYSANSPRYPLHQDLLEW